MQFCHLHFYDFFCFGFTSFSSSFRCLFCVPLRSSRASASHFRCFCVVSFLLIVFYDLFSGFFFQSLFQPTQMTFTLAFSSSFTFALNFSLSSMYLSLTARLLSLNRGNLRPFKLFAIFP